MCEKTLTGYMRSAATWWRQTLGWEIPMYNPATQFSKQPKMHPLLSDILQQRKAWKKPKEKRLPFTFRMYDVLHSFIQQNMTVNKLFFLTITAAIFDWMRLGLFTGSRLGEYGQSKPRKGERFAIIPISEHAEEWAGMPLAFIASDFQLFDMNMILLSHAECLVDPSRAFYVQVRFRYDKGPDNFLLRKWRRVDSSFLCPVKAIISILRRARMLRIPANEPLGAFRSVEGAPITFIKGEHVSTVMQWACIEAYPNPSHYMRCNIKLLHSHSNRITAAVAMHNAGVTFEIIAVRLRWSVETVKFYLRDCFHKIGELTEQAVNGAMLC